MLQKQIPVELTCGVAMCTYNGMPYIEPQLRSLLAQGRLPDRLVIFDDGSEDGTWEFLQTWVTTAPIPTSLHRNPVRQGVVKNFESAVRALDTDLIFLCDQDDIWLPDKTTLILQEFRADPSVLLVHTDAQLVDEDARDLGVTLFQAMDLSHQERTRLTGGDAFRALCRRNLVTGATAAFRRGLLELAQPFPPCWLHDEWLAILAAASGRLVLVERPTILYRQHAQNLVGAQSQNLMGNIRRLLGFSSLPPGAFQAERVARTSALLERLQAAPDVRPAYREVARGALAHARTRAALPPNPFLRVWSVLRESTSGSYQRYSTGLRGMLRDMLNR